MTSKIDGSKIRTFFKTWDNGESRDSCNCPENPQVARTFVIDMTNGATELYWVDPWVHRILAADMDGCKCRVVVDATEKKKYGFTPMSITVDSKYIYWFNSTEKAIFYTEKNKRSKVDFVKITYGYKIMALDPANQLYPPIHCLYPRSQNLRPKMLSTTANSITLQLPHVGKPNRCHDIEYEMAATEYTVFYRLQKTKDTTTCYKESCSFITTTNTEVVLRDLLPFTNYSVMVEATNYYAKLHEVKPVVGYPFVLHTASEGRSYFTP